MTDNMRNRVKEIRLTKGMTQTALAKEIGVTVSHLNKIENHKQGKYLTTVIAAKIAYVLDVPMKDLFLDEN